MGTDYTGHYGIGYQVDVEYDEEQTYITEILDDLLDDNDKYSYFEIGSEMYGGDLNTFYVVIDNALEKSLDLTEDKNDLFKFLYSNNIDIIGEFGLVGGLLID